MRAVQDFEQQGVCCIFDLGDVVDRRAGDECRASLQEILHLWNPATIPTFHLVGNLMTYRDVVYIKEAFVRPPGSLYFSYQVGEITFIALDTYDLAFCGSPSRATETERLYQKLRSSSRSPHLHQHPELNGGLSATQMLWLEERLMQVQKYGGFAVMISHAPLYPGLTKYGDAACWNGPEVVQLIDKYSSHVLCCLAGHDHYGAECVHQEAFRM